jgi:hypothetical protein
LNRCCFDAFLPGQNYFCGRPHFSLDTRFAAGDTVFMLSAMVASSRRRTTMTRTYYARRQDALQYAREQRALDATARVYQQRTRGVQASAVRGRGLEAVDLTEYYVEVDNAQQAGPQ